MHKCFTRLNAQHFFASLLLLFCCQPSLAQSPFHYSQPFLIERGYDYKVTAWVGDEEDTDRLVFPYQTVKQLTPKRSGGTLAHEWEYLLSPFAKVEAYGATSKTMGTRVGNKKLKATQSTISFAFAETIEDKMIIDGSEGSGGGPIGAIILAGGYGASINQVNGIVPFRLTKYTKLKLDSLRLCLSASSLFGDGDCRAGATATISILQDVNGNGRIDKNDSSIYSRSLTSVLYTESVESDCQEIVDDLFELQAGRYILLTEVQNRLITELNPVNIYDVFVHVDSLSSACIASGSISVLPTPELSAP